MRDPRLANRTVVFGGPEELTQLEVVAIYEQLLGRTIATEIVHRSELEAMLADAVSPTQESLAGVLLEATVPSDPEWSEFDETFAFRRTSVADFAASTTDARSHE